MALRTEKQVQVRDATQLVDSLIPGHHPNIGTILVMYDPIGTVFHQHLVWIHMRTANISDYDIETYREHYKEMTLEMELREMRELGLQEPEDCICQDSRRLLLESLIEH